MGCDIHAHIETVLTLPDNRIYTKHFAEINISRDYDLFEVLAGVRRDSNPKKFISPKGMPEDLSFRVFREYYSILGSYDSEFRMSSLSEEYIEKHNISVIEKWGSRFVKCADWHSASWLNIEELENAKKEYSKFYMKDPEMTEDIYKNVEDNKIKTLEEYYSWIDSIPEIPANNKQLNSIISAMRELEWTNEKPRLVFWFDN